VFVLITNYKQIVPIRVFGVIVSVEPELALIMLSQIVKRCQPSANGILLALIIIVLPSQKKKLVKIFLLLKNVLGKILVYHSLYAQTLHLVKLDVRKNKGIVKTIMMVPHVNIFLPMLVLFIQMSKSVTLTIPLPLFAFGTLLAKICHCVLKSKTKKNVKCFPLNVFMT